MQNDIPISSGHCISGLFSFQKGVNLPTEQRLFFLEKYYGCYFPHAASSFRIGILNRLIVYSTYIIAPSLLYVKCCIKNKTLQKKFLIKLSSFPLCKNLMY